MRQYYVFFVVCVLLKGKMENFAFRTFDLGAVVECKTNPKCLFKKNPPKKTMQLACTVVPQIC